MSQDINKERQVFTEAVELPPERRMAFLERACGTDVEFRRRVQELLDAHSDESPVLRTVRDAGPGVEGLSEGPGSVIDRYKLLQKLGEGGFGVVYMAEQREPVKRRVALKIIKLGMDTKQVVARFEAERQALALMDHPNIAKVLDAGATAMGRPYFVMELVRGVPITGYCDENRLNTPERLVLFLAVCSAVQHAHQKGIIHRDLKPSNILVTLHDGVPVPKVIDFGIAKATQQELTEKTVFTQLRQMIGTPAYMSPEQAEMSGLDIDTRTDIYSLGVLLYELLTSRTPLDELELLSGGYDEIRRRIKEEEPIRPSTRARTLQGKERTTVAEHRKVDPSRLGSELKGDLDWIVMKALEKDRTRRYDTAKGFANDVRRYLIHEPVEAAAPSVGYRCLKFIVRHRAAVAVTIAMAGLLVTGTIVSTWQAVRATQASAKERAERQRAEAAERRANQEALAARRNLYVSDIHLARQALEASDVGRARQLLERHVPRSDLSTTNPTAEPGQDLRGWEWRYLRSQLQTVEPEIFASLPGPVCGLALSPDGRHLVASTTHGLIKLWKFPSGCEVATLELGNGGNTKAVFFPDSSRLLYNHVTRSSDQVSGAFRVWDLHSRRITREIPYPGVVGPKLISRDGQRFLFGVVPDVYRLFDLRSGMAPWEVRSAIWRHSGDSFLFSEPDGREWILGGADGHLSIFDVATGERTGHWPAHSEKITALRFSPDARLLVSASGYLEKTIKLWDCRTHELVGEFTGHQSWVNDLEFTSDGRRLVSASGDQTVRLWDVTTLAELAVFRGQEQEVWEVELSRDDRMIIAGVKDGSICVWDATEPAREDSPVIASDIAQFALARSGPPMAVLSRDGSVRTGTLQDNVTLTPADYARADNSCVRLSADGHQLILGKTNGAVTVCELATGELIHSNHLHHAALSSALLLASEDLILSRDQEGNTLLRKIGGQANETLWSVRKDPMETSSYFRGFAVSPDERIMATATYSGLVSLRDLTTGRQIGTFQNPSPDAIVSDARFSPDGATLAIADAYGVVGLWDVATRRRRLALQGHRNAAGSLCFSPDGRRLVSGAGANASVILWDLATRQELLRLRANGTIRQLAFSPDGSRLLVLSSTGDLYAWRAPP